MLYARVGNARRRAQPELGGCCPGCGGEVIPKCGALRAWHWAHRSRADCDPWSEPVGPWHRAWQDVVRPEYVEVVIGPHRADILGNGGTVVELQHSPLSPGDVAERELFYGDMLWLFDATFRFAGVRCGERCFFSLGRTQHIAACRKQVFLDFGDSVVQVEAFSDALDGFSGFGTIRDRRWFAAEFLSQRLAAEPPMHVARSETVGADAWPGGQPWRLTEHASPWVDPRSGTTVIHPRGTLTIPLKLSVGEGRPAWFDLLARYPEIANGWRCEDLLAMHDLLGGMPLLLDGRLRLMPPRAEHISVRRTVSSVERLLKQADLHIQAGRLPVLKHATRQLLLERAAQFEIATFGGRLGFPRYRRGRA